MDLEKEHDRKDLNGIWMLLRLFGEYCRLVEAIKNLYEKSKFCVGFKGAENIWVQVRVGLR